MPVSCSSARRALASASALRNFSMGSRSFFLKCSSSLARMWSVMPSEFVTECLLRSVFHRSTSTGVAYNAGTHAGPDDWLPYASSAQDDELHARDHGLSDTLLPR